MNVLLVQAYLGRREPPVYPLGLSYVASAVRDHTVRIVDPNVADNPHQAVRDAIAESRPSVVGVSVRNIDNQERRTFFYFFAHVRPLLQTIRDAAPKSVIVLGGAGFSIFPRQMMTRCPEADMGVYLEGEESFPELLDNLDHTEKVAGIYYRDGDRVVSTGPRSFPDFANLAIPRRDFHDMGPYLADPYAIGVQTKRGCAYRCAYCTYYNLNGGMIRLREPPQIVDEIERLQSAYGATNIVFADALFTSPLEHATAICQEILRRGIKVRWTAWRGIANMTWEFMELARDAGCIWFGFSPDALSPPALTALQRDHTRQDVKRVFGYAKAIEGAQSSFGLFVGPPKETWRGYLATLGFFARGNLGLVRRRKGGVGLNWLRIEPDTRLERIALEEEVITPETDLLPPDSDGSGLFYRHRRFRRLDGVVRKFLNFLDSARDWRRRRSAKGPSVVRTHLTEAFRLLYWSLVRFAVQAVSLKMCYRLGRAAAKVMYWISPGKKRRVRQGLHFLLGEGNHKEAVRRTLVNYVQNSLEVFLYPSLSEGKLGRMVVYEGIEHLERAFEERRGVILLHGHFGNEELLMAAFGYRDATLYQLASRQPPASLPGLRHWFPNWVRRYAFKKRLQYRESLPTDFIYIDRGLRAAFDALRRNQMLLVAADGREGSSWTEAEMLGRKVVYATGPMRIALRSNAVVLPVFLVRRDDDRHRVVIEPPMELTRTGDAKADIAVNTQRFVSLLGEYIEKYPCHYARLFWLGMDYFKDFPPEPSPNASLGGHVGHSIAQQREYGPH